MQYAWLIWSLILIGIWLVVYVLLGSKEQKKEMLAVSFWTSLTGLTEPLFVPRYWSPPSLFNLNVLTGFDIESIIWAFGVGGIVAVLYEFIFRARRHSHLPHSERQQRRHRLHYLTIGATPILLIALLLTTGWNPIYSSIAALLIGGFAAWYCRPDLKPKMIASAFLFLAVYFLYFLTLTAMYPAYVEAVWNLPELSGMLVAGVPLEELLFAFSFGFMWSSVYEHFGWYRLIKSS
ncbi:hypothetical protein A3D54_01055 [Candidatus Falkowbacteria bacterium RIFCSPHIGHO2_02_FULL_45_15]|uniref:Lycopene cyclase domain-containing protein n=1 Tax=Candidatus Falkowbacteria bacterium RIFCSPHIGHO2_02_FULL_45_15 TaxID=1797987 RepID=A0A1F5RYA0_9BACT|nr:MAG: hypothetical protein A3D54_01055 [Candidatus Falkowbacteria bacterium RIFCSPHIGHO2_02_FULL_45_15]